MKWYQGSTWSNEDDLIPEDSEPYIDPDDDCWAESAEEWAAGMFDE